jgi:PBP1b-binding outer membrane lipoprotein LpoB
MKRLNRVSSLLLLAVVMTGCSVSQSATSSLPQLDEVTAATGSLIATDLSVELSAAKNQPRANREIRTASVEVVEVSDLVVVEASRLPIVEHLADAATL